MTTTLWDWLGKDPHHDWQTMPLEAMTFFATLDRHATDVDPSPTALDARLRANPDMALDLSVDEVATLDRAYAAQGR